MTTENPRAEKVAVVEEVTAKLQAAEAVFVTEYRGMSVGQLANLRRQLKPLGRQAEVARQEGVLEIGLAVRTRGQQRDARRVAVAQTRRDLDGLLLHRVEQSPVCRRDVLHPHLAKRVEIGRAHV